MEKLNKIGRLGLISLLATTLFAFCSVSYAEDANGGVKSEVKKVEKPKVDSFVRDNLDKYDLVEQYAPLHGAAQLKMQLRYKGDELVGINFWNSSEPPLEVEIFSKSYVLGDKDVLLISSIPTVDKFRVHVGVYDPQASDEVQDTHGGRTFIFRRDDKDRFFKVFK